MNRVLIYFVHADPVVRVLYDGALANVGAPVDIVFVNQAGLSSAYERLAGTLSGPTRLEALKAKYRPPHSEYAATVLNTFSAGYALARWLLADPATVDAVSAYSAIDSVHAGLDPDGTARDASLPWLVDFAKLARDGKKSLWLGHSDVPTPQTGPGAFASTTQVAKELVRLAGEPKNRFHVRAFNVEQNPAAEHRKALTGWGPEWLAACVREVLESQSPSPPPLPPSPPSDESLGVRALKIAVEELTTGVREVPPGSNAGPRIKQYFSGCERGGKKLGISSGPWCAAAVSWCAFQARKPHEEQSHKWRAAVTELVADARAWGTWREKTSSYVPVPGDLAIFKRDGGDPTKGGIGHVGRIEGVSGATYVTVDGNSGTPSVGWARNPRKFDDPMLCGWISYGSPATPTSVDLLAAATLRAAATAEVS